MAAMAPARENAIEIRDVWKSYAPGTDFALRGITLHVAREDFVALTGASGGGKTTLLKMINRLNEPSRGSVLVSGEDVSLADPVCDKSPHHVLITQAIERARQVGAGVQTKPVLFYRDDKNSRALSRKSAA